MLGQEGGQQRRHVLAAEAGRRRHQQVAAGARAALGHRRFRFLQFAQNALAIFEESGALVGQRELAGGALQQLDAEPRFERIEAAPDHGRRDAFGARRGRQAAARDYLDKGGNLAKLAHA